MQFFEELVEELLAAEKVTLDELPRTGLTFFMKAQLKEYEELEKYERDKWVKI